MERKVKPVESNIDKQRTYREMLGKYRRAVNGEFYFEALLIDYAMIEDRFLSFLYYFGALKTRQSFRFDNDVVKKHIKPIVEKYSGEKKPNLGISSLAGKMRIVSSVFIWSININCAPHEDYLRILKNECEGIDIDGMLQTINEINEWKDYRNEIIHAVMNKNMDSLGSDLPAKVEQGMALARYLDDQIKILKKENKIRKALGLK